jgi:hypothetical protein
MHMASIQKRVLERGSRRWCRVEYRFLVTLKSAPLHQILRRFLVASPHVYDRAVQSRSGSGGVEAGDSWGRDRLSRVHVMSLSWLGPGWRRRTRMSNGPRLNA